MRLVCRCGENLADVWDGWTPHPVSGGRNPEWTPDGLTVTPRPGMRLGFRSYRPPPPVSEGVGAPRTYTFDCKCGETWQLRHGRVTALWAEHADTPGKVVRVALG